MNAKSATQRMTLVMMCLLLILTTTALAKNDQPGYLGVMLQKITTSMSKALQLEDSEGVMISMVVDGGPAAKAGFEDGDVILKFAGKAIEKLSMEARMSISNMAIRPSCASGGCAKNLYQHATTPE